MEKITMTELAKSYFDFDKQAGHFPSISSNYSKVNSENMQPQTRNSKGVNYQSLRQLLRDESVSEIHKLRESSEQRAFIKVRQELLKDISNNKQFLNMKAQMMAKKIIVESEKGYKTNLCIEIGKGKNYLNKIVNDFQAKRTQDYKIQSHIKEKLKQRTQF